MTSPLILLFETHSTSTDNEAGVASGHGDVDLSRLGERQAAELGERYRLDPPDVVYTSDLRRSWRTAEIAFGHTLPVVRDRRLRECDYGSLTGQPGTVIATMREQTIDQPFPGGESYAQVVRRVAEWLDEVRHGHAKRVLVIGHRATHYAIDHLVSGVALRTAVLRPFTWQPGWSYQVDRGENGRAR
jgi:2,3-bisphosphoglycerate-dependent phosphoglycerate mutase